MEHTRSTPTRALKRMQKNYLHREEFQAKFSSLLSANRLCDKVYEVFMHDCACVISFASHFTTLWKGDL